MLSLSVSTGLSDISSLSYLQSKSSLLSVSTSPAPSSSSSKLEQLPFLISMKLLKMFVYLGQDMSSPVASVASTSAPTVTQRVSPISVLNPIRLTPTYSNTSRKNPQGNKASQFSKDKPSVYCMLCCSFICKQSFSNIRQVTVQSY